MKEQALSAERRSYDLSRFCNPLNGVESPDSDCFNALLRHLFMIYNYYQIEEGSVDEEELKTEVQCLLKKKFQNDPSVDQFWIDLFEAVQSQLAEKRSQISNYEQIQNFRINYEKCLRVEYLTEKKRNEHTPSSIAEIMDPTIFKKIQRLMGTSP